MSAPEQFGSPATGPRPSSHGAAVGQLVGELVPMAELLLPLVRKPLAARLDADLAAIDLRVATDPAKALSVYGIAVEGDRADAVHASAMKSTEWAREEVRALIAALESGAPMAVSAFVDRLLLDLVPAMQLAGALRRAPATVTPRDLEEVVRGDTAFRLLAVFLEHAQAAVRALLPRSALAVRSLP